MDEDLFKEEEEFFCSICGKKIELDDEITEEICHLCLVSMIEDKKKILDVD